MQRFRLLVVESHPVQYYAPLYRQLAQESPFDVTVAYCSLQGARPGRDPGFGVEVVWDRPLLEGYPWVHPPNRSFTPGLATFWGLWNPGLWRFIQRGRFDAVMTHGYAYASYWTAILAAKWAKTPLLLVTDAISIQPGDGRGSWWKGPFKPWAVPAIYKMADVVIALSTPTQEFLTTLGVSPTRLVLCPYTVDVEYFTRRAAETEVGQVRAQWGIPQSAAVVLFCGKLVPWKRPGDVLEAFARARLSSAWVVMAGDGPLRLALERQARSLGMADRVRMLGFVNQSQLPSVYAASNLVVLPSEREPWGLVVNEAMACGVPAVVSDQVGCHRDLIQPGVTGETYPVGDIQALSALLRQGVSDPERVRQMGRAAQQRIQTWSYREYMEGLAQAVAKTRAFSRRRADRNGRSGGMG